MNKELTYKEGDKIFIKTFAYISEGLRIEVEGGELRIENTTLNYELGFSHKNNYKIFEDAILKKHGRTLPLEKLTEWKCSQFCKWLIVSTQTKNT